MTFPQAKVVCHNGRLIPGEQAQVSVFHPALYGAFGVYESIEVIEGVVFYLDDHLERLAASAAMLALELPAPPATLAGWVPPLLARSQLPSCLLRLFVLGPNGGSPAEAFVWPQALPVYPRTLFEEGAGAVTFEGERSLPRAKSLNTLVNFLARRSAQLQGEHEGLLVSRDTVKEGSSSNLFVVRGSRLCMPPAKEVLEGVTASIVANLATQAGLALSNEPLAVADIPAWDEAFLTSTSRHIMPLVRVDGRAIGSGRPGPVTQRLAQAFELAVSDYVRAHR